MSLREHLTLLRECIHDASAPVDNELRREMRRLLWTIAAIPAAVIAFGCLLYELWVST